MKARFAVAIIIATAVSLAVGIAPRSNAASHFRSSDAATVPLLRAGTILLASNIDPARQYNDFTLSPALEQLLTFGPDGRLKPWLAERVTRLSPTVAVYHLRKGVKFWNGNEMTARDVANALNYYRDPSFSGSSAYRSVRTIVAKSRYTVVVTLKHIDASFEQALAWQGAIFERKFQLADKQNFGKPSRLVMGTGPFKIDSLDPTRGMELSAFDGYWGGKPQVRRISIKKFADETSMALAFRGGEIDMAFPLQAAPFASASGAKLQSATANAVGYFGMNYRVGPWSDVHVRRAVAYALDRSALIKASGNPGTLVSTFIPPHQLQMVGTKADVAKLIKSLPQYPYSLAKARAELARSAYPNGFSDNLVVRNRTATVSQAIAGMLERIGIKLKVVQLTDGPWVDKVLNDRSNGSLFSVFNLPSPDPSSYPSWLLGAKNAAKGQWNWANYDRPDIDPLLREGVRSADSEKRFAIYSRLEKTVANDMPYVPLYIEKYNLALASKFAWPTFNGNYRRIVWPLQVKSR